MFLLTMQKALRFPERLLHIYYTTLCPLRTRLVTCGKMRYM